MFYSLLTLISFFALVVNSSLPPATWSDWATTSTSPPGSVTNFMEIRYLLWKWFNFSLLMMLWTVIGYLSFSFLLPQVLAFFIVFQFDSDFDLLWLVCYNLCLSLYVGLLALFSGVCAFDWFWPVKSIYRGSVGAESRRSWEEKVGIRKLPWLFWNMPLSPIENMDSFLKFLFDRQWNCLVFNEKFEGLPSKFLRLMILFCDPETWFFSSSVLLFLWQLLCRFWLLESKRDL